MNRLFTSWQRYDGHPSEDELLLFVDGEMPSKTNGKLRTHLDACWSCRVRTEKIEETISTFIDYRNYVLKPLIAPTHGWRRFDGNLNGLAAEIGKPSIFSGVLGTLSRLFSAPHLSLSWERGRLVRILSLDSPMLVRALTAVALAAVIVASFVYLNRTPVVSAGEILQRANDAQEQQIRGTNQAVIYQKLQVRRMPAGSSSAETLTWEVWHDVGNGRFVQKCDGCSTESPKTRTVVAAPDTRHPTPVTPHPAPDTLAKLNTVLRANHMNPARPLSAASYDAWRRSVAHKNEEVTKTIIGGHEVFSLKTTPTGAINVGQIVEASLVVRTSDWHSVAGRLRVKGDQGDEEFELIETAYSVVSLTALDPKIFAEPPVTSTSISSSTPDTLNPTPESTSPLALTPLPAASAALEVAVLEQLNRINAFYGEQLSVTRTPENQLRVHGIVETNQRKQEILQALAALRNDPALHVEVETVAEAAARQTRKGSANAPEVSNVDVETKTSIPVDAELRAHFSRQGLTGEQLDEAIRRFADRMLAHGREARRQALALKQIAARFTADELRGLDEPTRNKWRAMLAQHAHLLRQEVATLRRELQPVFPNVSAASGSGAAITSDTDLAPAAQRLFALATAIDQDVSRSFSIYMSSESAAPVKTAQFARTLSEAAKIAGSIGAKQ